MSIALLPVRQDRVRGRGNISADRLHQPALIGRLSCRDQGIIIEQVLKRIKTACGDRDIRIAVNRSTDRVLICDQCAKGARRCAAAIGPERKRIGTVILFGRSKPQVTGRDPRVERIARQNHMAE